MLPGMMHLIQLRIRYLVLLKPLARLLREQLPIKEMTEVSQ
jgi:hypothetical protein